MNVSTVGFKRFAVDTTQTNRKTVTLQYTETPAIIQGLAANKAVSVQPFLFGQFNGTLLLSPETDYWVSETLKPEVITVPERIIENHTVIREIITEPSPPVTIINVLPTINAATQIIETPGGDPPAPPSEEIVVVEPPAPPAPVIPPSPVLVQTEYDPWQETSCPAPWMMITLGNGYKIPAGELKPGMFVRAAHEHTMDVGQYEVTHVESVQDEERILIEFEHVDFVCSLTHKFFMNGEWVEAENLEVGDVVGLAPQEYEVLGIREYDDGEVMKITVNEAHTYFCEDILSHNKLPTRDPQPFIDPVLPDVVVPLVPPDPPNLEIKFEFDPWWGIIPRNMFGWGGSFDGSSWFPAVMPTITDIPPPIESPNPMLSEPIILGAPIEDVSASLITTATRNGGGGRDIDMDFLNFKYDLN